MDISMSPHTLVSSPGRCSMCRQQLPPLSEHENMALYACCGSPLCLDCSQSNQACPLHGKNAMTAFSAGTFDDNWYSRNELPHAPETWTCPRCEAPHSVVFAWCRICGEKEVSHPRRCCPQRRKCRRPGRRLQTPSPAIMAGQYPAPRPGSGRPSRWAPTTSHLFPPWRCPRCGVNHRIINPQCEGCGILYARHPNECCPMNPSCEKVAVLSDEATAMLVPPPPPRHRLRGSAVGGPPVPPQASHLVQPSFAQPAICG